MSHFENLVNCFMKESKIRKNSCIKSPQHEVTSVICHIQLPVSAEYKQTKQSELHILERLSTF